MLADAAHLASLTAWKSGGPWSDTFLEATIKAIPGARKNTMNGNTLPDFVLGVVREKGHPVQLVNAFESPLRSNQGYAAESVKRLKTEYEKLKTTWGIEAILDQRDSGSEPAVVPGRGSEACRLKTSVLPSVCRGRFNPGASTASTIAATPASCPPRAGWPACAALPLVSDAAARTRGDFSRSLRLVRMTTLAIPRVVESNFRNGGGKRKLNVRRLQDYHTVQNTRKADGGMKDCHITHRQYLTDAAFGILMEGRTVLLKQMADALADPKWGIWLGRKTCVPSAPVLAGMCDSRSEALKLLIGDEPLESFTRQEDAESFAEGRDSLPDQAVSFASDRRAFTLRRIRTTQGTS